MLANVAAWHAPATQIVIVGADAANETTALERVVASKFLPFAVQIPIDSASPQRFDDMPWLEAMVARENAATAYVCRDFACQAPVTDGEELAKQLA